MLCVAILITNYPSASSADIDGIHDGVEWDSAVVNKLLDGESNSGVNFGLVQTMIDSENSALFLCFMHKDPLLEVDNVSTGVAVSVENSDYFEVTPALSPAYSDSSEHSFEGFVTVDENNGATTEIRVGFKFGIPREIRCKVRFIDSSGALSNVYGFTVVNDEYSETTELVITHVEPEKTEKSTTARSAETTKTRKATTKKKAETKKKTTAKQTEKKTDDFVISKTPRRYTYVRTTKSRTTEKPETVAKTKKASPVSVYHYEKEVIISHVYITHTEETATVNNVTDNNETTALQMQIATPAEHETEIKSSFSLSEGTKKKAVIGVFAAISFTIIAAAGTRSSRKSSDKNNDNNPDSQ